MDEHHKTITVERPTGPRITAEEPKSIGQLVSVRAKTASRSVVSAAVTGAAAGLAVLTRHKFATTVGASAVVAVATHLIVATMMMGVIQNPRGGTVAFQGPGDVVASATAWWGLRAYSAAKKGNPAINLCNVLDVTCADVATDATTGDLVAPTNIGGTDCTLITTCTIKKWYDQTQGTGCGGSNCDSIQSTIASRYTFTWNCQGGHPCAKGAGGSIVPGSTPAFSSAAALFTISAVGERTGATTTQTAIIDAAGMFVGFDATAGTAFMYFGNFLKTAAADSAPHAIVAVFNPPSGVLDVDVIGGTSGNPGATSTSASILLGTDNTTGLNGNFEEVGIWPIAFSGSGGGQQDLMLSNMRTYWGF